MADRVEPLSDERESILGRLRSENAELRRENSALVAVNDAWMQGYAAHLRLVAELRSDNAALREANAILGAQIQDAEEETRG